MSGGHFDYKQYALQDIADQIGEVIVNNDSTEKNQWGENKGHSYPPAVIEELEMALRVLRRAAVYVHRVDYLLSGDDSEESFIRRLAEDLEKLK